MGLEDDDIRLSSKFSSRFCAWKNYGYKLSNTRGLYGTECAVEKWS